MGDHDPPLRPESPVKLSTHAVEDTEPLCLGPPLRVLDFPVGNRLIQIKFIAGDDRLAEECSLLAGLPFVPNLIPLIANCGVGVEADLSPETASLANRRRRLLERGVC